MLNTKLEQEFQAYIKNKGLSYNNQRTSDQFRKKLVEEYGVKLDIDFLDDSFFKNLKNDEKVVNKVKELGTIKNGYDEIITMLSNWIFTTAADLGHEVNREQILIKQFPTNIFNASAISLDSGKVILFNVGLMQLFNKVIKIMAWDAIHHFSNNKEYAGPTEILKITFEAFQLNGNVNETPRLPGIPNSFQLLFASLLLNLEKFVMAHEIGHIILGHLDDKFIPIPNTKKEFKEFFQKRQEQEFEADKFAAQCILESYRKEIQITADKPQPPKGYKRAFSNTTSSPFLFFAIGDLHMNLKSMKTGQVTKVSEEEFDSIENNINAYEKQLTYTTHPPMAERFKRILEFYKTQLDTEEQGFMMQFPRWFIENSKKVIETTNE